MERTKSALERVFNYVSGLSGLLSIALLVWKGGFLWNTVFDSHERRITAIEQGGSRGLEVHVKQDDERVADLRSRTGRLEEAVLQFSEIKKDVAVLNVKLDSLKDKLEDQLVIQKQTK